MRLKLRKTIQLYFIGMNRNLIELDGFWYVYLLNLKPTIGSLVYSIRGQVGLFGTFENSYEDECFNIIATNDPKFKKTELLFFLTIENEKNE